MQTFSGFPIRRCTGVCREFQTFDFDWIPWIVSLQRVFPHLSAPDCRHLLCAALANPYASVTCKCRYSAHTTFLISTLMSSSPRSFFLIWIRALHKWLDALLCFCYSTDHTHGHDTNIAKSIYWMLSACQNIFLSFNEACIPPYSNYYQCNIMNAGFQGRYDIFFLKVLS